MTQPPDPSELETALVAVYRGPLDEFISRRDALAKQLRADKRREDADRIKALRKPSRTAWVLDNIVHEDPTVLDQLAAAINAAQTVQSGPDLRTALETVRAAVRAVAASGARVAIRAGQPMEANVLVNAVQAVIGDRRAFSDLRAGRLIDVPDGGGLDILTAIPTIAASPPSIAPPAPKPAKAKPSAEPATQEDDLAIAARAHLSRAETALADARGLVERAEQSVRENHAKLDAAERALLQAEGEAHARRADGERARLDAEAAATRLRDAERAVAAARARLLDLGKR
jgi:hypothetical protein